MQRTIEAVYENGVLRPLEPVTFAENEHVQVYVESEESYEARMKALFGEDEWEAAKHETLTHEEVRQSLANDTSSWSRAIIEARNERF